MGLTKEYAERTQHVWSAADALASVTPVVIVVPTDTRTVNT